VYFTNVWCLKRSAPFALHNRFPNVKIVLFPTPVLREVFYNEYISKYSKCYDIDTVDHIKTKTSKGIKREIKTRPNGTRYEVLDSFNIKYGTNKDFDTECTVRGTYESPLFEDYHMFPTSQDSILFYFIL